MITPAGLLTEALYLPSPHHDQRPAQTTIDSIIIHCISLPKNEFHNTIVHRLFLGQLQQDDGKFLTKSDFDTLQNTRVSAHLLIGRCGEIWQFVPFLQRAWHAGASSLGTRQQCNDFSIGIELMGSDELPYPPVQYTVLSSVITQLLAAYPNIRNDNIVAHSAIAPGRKTDPGPAFSWDTLTAALPSQDI